MKKFLVLLIGIILFFGGCEKKDLGNSTDNTKSIVKIGIIAPLTGEYASYGKSVKRGVELAYNNLPINIKNSIQLIYQDSKMNPKDGVNALNYIKTKGAKIVIGPFGSGSVLAIAKKANQDKITLISASATADNIENAGKYIFRIVPKNEIQGKTAANFINQTLKINNNICILHEVTDYGNSLKNSFINNISKRNNIKLIETYKRGDKDFKNQILKIKNNKCEVVYFPGAYTENAIILKQARENSINIPFVGADGGFSDDLIKNAKNATKNTFFTFMNVEKNEQYFVFKKKLKETYNIDNDVFALYYYDLATMLFSKIDEINNANNIPEFLINMKPYNGLTDTIKFNEKGEVNKNFGVYQIVNGAFEIVN